MQCATIEDNYMVVQTHKTNQEVVIPIHPIVREIINKYNGIIPKSVDKARTLAQIRQCALIAGITSPITISRVKGGRTILRKGVKADFIQNHTARRSFATNMFLRGVPAISIMAITGHHTEANFLKYIKLDKKQHAHIVGRAFDMALPK